MERGDETAVGPSYEELERAIASVPGVESAAVGVAEDTGRGRLRIRLAPGEDPEQVSWAVAATLRERFGIALDPDAIRPRLDAATTPAAGDAGSHDRIRLVADDQPADSSPLRDAAQRALDGVHGRFGRGGPMARRLEGAEAFFDHDEPAAPDPPPTAAPSAPAPPPAATPPAPQAAVAPTGPDRPRVRAAISDLVTRRADDELQVDATLEHAGRRGRGSAHAVATRSALWRGVAQATHAALRELTGPRLRAGIEHVSVASREVPAVVTVLVSVLSDRGEERLLGAALLHDDPERAVMRATLDALNRRVEPLLRGEGATG